MAYQYKPGASKNLTGGRFGGGGITRARGDTERLGISSDAGSPTRETAKSEMISSLQQRQRASVSNWKPSSYDSHQPTKAEKRVVSKATSISATDKMYSDYQSTKSKFGKLYQKIDYGLFGWLPGGISRDVVKAVDLERKAVDVALVSQANADLKKVKTEVDLGKTTIWEKYAPEFLGGNTTEENQAEQQYQKIIRQGNVTEIFRETNIIKEIGQDLGQGVVSGFVGGGSDTPQTLTSLSNFALIGVAAILGIMVMKK